MYSAEMVTMLLDALDRLAVDKTVIVLSGIIGDSAMERFRQTVLQRFCGFSISEEDMWHPRAIYILQKIKQSF
jgi:hypothetical protein